MVPIMNCISLCLCRMGSDKESIINGLQHLDKPASGFIEIKTRYVRDHKGWRQRGRERRVGGRRGVGNST